MMMATMALTQTIMMTQGMETAAMMTMVITVATNTMATVSTGAMATALVTSVAVEVDTTATKMLISMAK